MVVLRTGSLFTDATRQLYVLKIFRFSRRICLTLKNGRAYRRHATGRGFRPAVGELSAISPDWRPRHDPADALDLPGSQSRSAIPRTATKDGANHLDLTGDFAWRFRRAFGYL